MNDLIQVNTFIRREEKTKLGSTFRLNFLELVRSSVVVYKMKKLLSSSTLTTYTYEKKKKGQFKETSVSLETAKFTYVTFHSLGTT